MTSFTDRHGVGPPDPPISVRHDAPPEFRRTVVSLVLSPRIQMSIKWARKVVCDALRVRPDPRFYDDRMMGHEVAQLVDTCAWYRVYEVAEAIYTALREQIHRKTSERYEAELNIYLRENGIGWHMRNGEFEARGTAALEASVASAEHQLEGVGLPTAAMLLRAARQKLSQRPEPDTRNAVNDAMAALEAVARHIAGNSKATFGDLVRTNPNLFPGALKKVAEGSWGYASEVTRHGHEGQVTTVADALLVVGIAAAFCEHLIENDRHAP